MGSATGIGMGGRLLAGRADSATPPWPLDGPANHLADARHASGLPARSRSSRGVAACLPSAVRLPGNRTLTRRRPVVGSIGLWLQPAGRRARRTRCREMRLRCACTCARRWGWWWWVATECDGVGGGARVCGRELLPSLTVSVSRVSPVGPVRRPDLTHATQPLEIGDACEMSQEMARNDESTSVHEQSHSAAACRSGHQVETKYSETARFFWLQFLS